MAGNCREWTLEVMRTDRRVIRGWDWFTHIQDHKPPVSGYYDGEPHNYNNFYGSRLTLVIQPNQP